MVSIIVFLEASSDMSSLIVTTLGPLEHSNNTPSNDTIMSPSVKANISRMEVELWFYKFFKSFHNETKVSFERKNFVK